MNNRGFNSIYFHMETENMLLIEKNNWNAVIQFFIWIWLFLINKNCGYSYHSCIKITIVQESKVESYEYIACVESDEIFQHNMIKLLSTAMSHAHAHLVTRPLKHTHTGTHRHIKRHTHWHTKHTHTHKFSLSQLLLLLPGKSIFLKRENKYI